MVGSRYRDKDAIIYQARFKLRSLSSLTCFKTLPTSPPNIHTARVEIVKESVGIFNTYLTANTFVSILESSPL